MSNETAPTPSADLSSVGTPDRPAIKARPMLLLFALVAYAIWMTILIIWAIQLRAANTPATTAPL